MHSNPENSAQTARHYRYDAQISLPLVIDTEQERALFIKSATFYILQNARIKLNPKKLYMVRIQLVLIGNSLLYY